MRALTIFLILITLSLCNGCEKSKMTLFRVPKEESNAPSVSNQGKDSNMPEVPGLAASTQRFPIPKWQIPQGWEEKPAGNMRKGSFLVKDEGGKEAEVTVLAFPGDVGGDLANINRWRTQINLLPLNSKELESLQTTTVDSLNATVVDFTGESESVVGIIVPKAGDSWFFKMMGDKSVVESQKQTFFRFLESVEFQ